MGAGSPSCRCEIDDYALEALQASVSSDFERKSTVIHLRGAGEEGLGEDVTYDAVDHDILQAAGPTLPLAGRYTLASLQRAPRRASSCSRSRRSARSPALPHLGVRVGRARPRAAPGRNARCTRRSGASRQPVRFVVSLRLGEPPTLEPLSAASALYPGAALQARSDELLG